MTADRLNPAVLAEDLRSLAEHGRLDAATVDMLRQAADALEENGEARAVVTTLNQAAGLSNDPPRNDGWYATAIIRALDGTARPARCQWCGDVTTLTADGMLSQHVRSDDGAGCPGSHGDDHEAPNAVPEVARPDPTEPARTTSGRADETPTDAQDRPTVGVPPSAEPQLGGPVSLDTLVGWVENALDVAAIAVTVHELDLSGRRSGTSPLRRLVKCLRSGGLLDEGGMVSVAAVRALAAGATVGEVADDYGTDRDLMREVASYVGCVHELPTDGMPDDATVGRAADILAGALHGSTAAVRLDRVWQIETAERMLRDTVGWLSADRPGGRG